MPCPLTDCGDQCQRCFEVHNVVFLLKDPGLPNIFSAPFRQGAHTQSLRAAWSVHARMLSAPLVLMHVFTTEALPLQWEIIDSVGTAPPPRYMHAATVIDTVEGAVFVFGG